MERKGAIPPSDTTRRVEMLLGPAAMERIARSRVILFGLGGVGSWCAEALVRSGIARITLVDPDVVVPSNLNRQAQATSLNIGAPKAGELRDRLLAVNPAAEVTAINAAFNAESAASFDLGSCDYAIDAIDSVAEKILLIERCLASGTVLFSSMGAAAKRDPTRVRVAPLGETKQCPLARLVRRGLREKGIDGSFLCVYSDEPPGDAASEEETGPDGGRKRVNGALVQVTAVFGFTLAGLVINDLAGRN